MTPSSRYNLVRLLSTSSSKNWSEALIFLRFLSEMGLSIQSIQSLAHFVDLIAYNIFVLPTKNVTDDNDDDDDDDDGDGDDVGTQ